MMSKEIRLLAELIAEVDRHLAAVAEIKRKQAELFDKRFAPSPKRKRI